MPRRDLIREQIEKFTPCFKITADELFQYSGNGKKCHNIDAYGITKAGMHIFASSLGQKAADILSNLYTRVGTFQSVPSIGRIWGKKSGSPTPHKTRCITPVPNFFDPLDSIIAARADNVGDHIRFLLGRDVMEGARPKTQPADVTFPLFGLFQHAMDDHSKGAVAGNT